MPPSRAALTRRLVSSRAMIVLLLAVAVAVSALTFTAWADVSHAGWPTVTGDHLTAARGDDLTAGTPDNDEILGGDGNDRIAGRGGDDILWGDKNPTGNDGWQHDTISGGRGSDWIYPSHGTNIIYAGAGDDHVKAYYGHGSINCGPGYDIAQVRMNQAYTLHNCEHVVHFCQYGSSPDGTCLTPTGKPAHASLRRTATTLAPPAWIVPAPSRASGGHRSSAARPRTIKRR